VSRPAILFEGFPAVGDGVLPSLVGGGERGRMRKDDKIARSQLKSTLDALPGVGRSANRIVVSGNLRQVDRGLLVRAVAEPILKRAVWEARAVSVVP
jgi:hypothetical protein